MITEIKRINRLYIHNNYFVNKITTLSLYQKNFLNNSIVNQKMQVLIQLQSSVGSQTIPNKFSV